MSIQIYHQALSTIDVENHHTIDVQNTNDRKNDDKNANQLNNNTKNGKQCRICLQETYPLIIVCKCSGTVKYVHEECLMHWAQQLVKKSLKQQEQEGDYQQLTSIDCQLCKQQIKLRIEWKDVHLSFDEAKLRNQDYFWPIIIVNVLIGLICATCLSFTLAVFIMVLTQNSRVDYERFKNDPYVTWSILIGSFLVGLIFLFKSIKEIYSVFIKKEFRLDGVVYKQILRKEDEESDLNQSKINAIKSIDDVKFNINLNNPTFQAYQYQGNNQYLQNIKSYQQKSDVNLIIPKGQSSNLNLKIQQIQKKNLVEMRIKETNTKILH